MNLSKNEMLILLSVKYLRIAERLNVCVKQVRNLSLLDKKGKLGKCVLICYYFSYLDYMLEVLSLYHSCLFF